MRKGEENIEAENLLENNDIQFYQLCSPFSWKCVQYGNKSVFQLRGHDNCVAYSTKG